MTDSRWLLDDPFVLNALLLVAASSLAVALTSCLWHYIYRNDSAPCISTPSQNQSTSLAQEQKDSKSTRSKERRRRGKDPLRDLFKGGKKSKALLKAIKADHDHSPSSADTLSNPSVHSASSTSRSHSPEPAGDVGHCASRPSAESDDGSSVKDTIPSGDPSAVEDLADHSTSAVCSHADRIRSRSSSPDSVTATDTHANVSSASMAIGHAELAPSSPPVPAPHVPQSRDFETPSLSAADKPGRARTRLRVSKIDPSIQPSPCAVDSVEISFPSIYPALRAVPCPSLSIAASTNLSADGAGPSTPTNSRESTPPPQTPSDPIYDTQHLHPGVAAAQSQLASMRDALEAARLREEKLRDVAEQANKERDDLCWRWNEDAGAWRRREAELQAQIHHLMQQVQAYAAAASFPSSGFPSPTSPHVHASPTLPHPALAPFPLPPAMQAQNSASPPAHVQALLTCAPMLSHAPGFTGSGYPGHGMSPLLWSGMGLLSSRDARRTPDSVRDWSRGRQRQQADKSASDESSLDGVDESDDDVWEEEEEFQNNVLADAILKRPESIRDLSVRKRTGGRGNPPASPLASTIAP